MERRLVSPLTNLSQLLNSYRQNSSGNVVLFNRRNNQIQLSLNAHSAENGVEASSSNGGRCPTCHRLLHEDTTGHAPAFMDSEYFRLLSSLNSDSSSDDNDSHSGDALRHGSEEEWAPGSLPRSAFNQGYFEQSVRVHAEIDLGSLSSVRSSEEAPVVSY